MRCAENDARWIDHERIGILIGQETCSSMVHISEEATMLGDSVDGLGVGGRLER